MKLTVGVLEENLAVNTTRSDKSGIQCFNLVSGHDDLDITTVVETIELVQKLKHGTLNFTLATRCGLVTLGTDSINLINEDDTGGVLGSDLEELSHESRTIAQVFLDQLATNDTEECSAGLVCNGLCEESLSCTGSTVENDTLWWLDTHLLVQLRVEQGQLDSFADFLNLLFQTTNVGV